MRKAEKLLGQNSMTYSLKKMPPSEVKQIIFDGNPICGYTTLPTEKNK